MWNASPKYSNKKLLAGWLLSCSNLEFTNDIIMNATFDTTKFRMKCRPYVTQLLNDIATKIQSLIRMYLAKREVRKIRIQQKKKLKRLKNKRLKEKLSSTENNGQKLRSSEEITRNDSLTSIGTEYSSSSPRNEITFGSALEGSMSSSITSEFAPFQSSIHFSSTSPLTNFSQRSKVKKLPLSQKQKPLSQPITRRMKEVNTAYSSNASKTQTNSSFSQGSLAHPSSSSPSLLMEQVKVLKNDLAAALHHRQISSSSLPSSSDSEMKEIMKNVLSEIRALRSNQGNNNNTRATIPANPLHMEENQTELKQNLDVVLSQILHIQQDLSEQKVMSTNISLQLQEQHQAMILMKGLGSRSNEFNDEIQQDEQEKRSFQMKDLESKVVKYEMEVEKLRHLLMNKDKESQRELQKVINAKNYLQKELNEVTSNLDHQKELVKELERRNAMRSQENELLKENFHKFEQNNLQKQQELMSQIHQTVDQLSVTKEEIKNYEQNISELNSNYSNSLFQITILKSEIQKLETNQGRELNDENMRRVENENQRLQQQFNDSQRRMKELEQSTLSLKEEKIKLLDEIAQQKTLISGATATHAKDLQQYQTKEKRFQDDYETLLKETNRLKELMVEKDAYTQTIQRKFSELESKSQLEAEKSVQEKVSLQSLMAKHEEDVKVNHYLRSRLKEAEERVYALEQHQLEVENLKYQTMKPPPYEINLKPISSDLKATSTSFVDKLMLDEQTKQVCLVA